jgi:hypothetical protein
MPSPSLDDHGQVNRNPDPHELLEATGRTITNNQSSPNIGSKNQTTIMAEPIYSSSGNIIRRERTSGNLLLVLNELPNYPNKISNINLFKAQRL